MKNTLLVAALTSLLSLLACTEALPPSRATTTMKSTPPPSSCPLGVDGASVVYEEIDQGARLTFTAPPAQVEALQRKARNAAALHGPGEHRGDGHEGKHGRGGDHGLRAMQMPPARATEKDLEGGARIDITPADDADLPVLRTKLQQRARELMASCE